MNDVSHKWRIIILVIVFIIWFLSGFTGVGFAQVRDATDSLSTDQSDLQMVSDSLMAQYAGQDRISEIAPLPDQKTTGLINYERTLVPLRHDGDNIFQSILDDTRFMDKIQQIKRNPVWNPFNAGQNGDLPYDYHYDEDGTTKSSQAIRFYAERKISQVAPYGFRLDGRYEDNWGPFPNQHTARLSALLSFSKRFTPSHTATIKLLGRDNGWHITDGNTVFTDRARYMLEEMNTWKSRTGGFEINVHGQLSPTNHYQINTQITLDQWASNPVDFSLSFPPNPGFSGFINNQQFIEDIFPVSPLSIFTALRSAQTLEFDATITSQLNTVHQLALSVETRLHRFNQVQLWQTPDVFDAFDLQVRPREFAIRLHDRLRFSTLVMGLGVQYRLYDPGSAQWRDVYRVLGDDRALQDDVRQLLITAGGDSRRTQIVSPHISVSYPSDAFNAHMTFSISSRTPTLETLYNSYVSSPYADRLITSLQPQRTTTLEGGLSVSRALYTADVTVFYRDSERYTPLFGPEVLPQTASNFTNYWGRVDQGLREQGGIEFSFVQRSTPVGVSRIRLSGRLSYRLLFGLGAIRDIGLPLRPQNPFLPGDLTTFDHRLNNFWNRRHWLAITGAVRFPSGVTLTAIGHVQSGAPYQMPDNGTINQIISFSDDAPIASGPWMRRIDGRVDVPIHSIKKTGGVLTLYVEARNIIDNTIVDTIPDPVTFERTGQPDNPVTNQTQWIYGPTRTIWTGIGFKW